MVDGNTPQRLGRPPQISREQILEAVAASPNVDGLTMRDLATRLGVRHGALYRWVKNRDELFDLIGDAVVDRVLRQADATGDWPTRLAALMRAMHREFRALPGYATHLSRPHPHNAHSTDRLRTVIVDMLHAAGVSRRSAEQSWYIVITGLIGWTAFQEQPTQLDLAPPSFETFLDVLMRGLPARDLPA